MPRIADKFCEFQACAVSVSSQPPAFNPDHRVRRVCLKSQVRTARAVAEGREAGIIQNIRPPFPTHAIFDRYFWGRRRRARSRRQAGRRVYYTGGGGGTRATFNTCRRVYNFHVSTKTECKDVF